ncbi:MAG: transglutaminase family protein [Hormoscilla sp. GM102CHS1]|nr:transglutaminase family protein [Hormoscilla sp. GM102CHS1]
MSDIKDPLSSIVPEKLTTQWRRTIRPIGVYALQGLASDGDLLVALDSVRGYLLQIDRARDNAIILNPYHYPHFQYGTGLAIWEKTLWFALDESVYYCDWGDLTPKVFTTLPYEVNGVAVLESIVYVTCRQLGYILIFDRNRTSEITRIRAPGVGVENITIKGEELWVADREEQTVFCLDRGTGEIIFSVLTPFESPTALTFHRGPDTEAEILYVAYAGEEPYIRDEPNSEPSYQLTWRDRTFIHPLHYYYNQAQHYAISNGYLIEMSYVEELSPLEEYYLENLEWRIALPASTHRQKVRQVEPIGLPFREEVEDGQRVAVFKFDRLKPHEGRIFGWKALIEVRSIKYNFVPLDLEEIPPLDRELQKRYLVDDDDLAMDTETVRQAAKEAIGRERNFLRQMISIRNYVYDRLSYGIKPKIDRPDLVLERGIGSCGEYVGVILGLARLNGIACRTIGRYKCPATPSQQGVPLIPDFNHVWLEFYIPGFGWVPMESNPDDVEDGPHLTRFFMGLAWYHIEIGKGISFEKLLRNGKPVNKEELSLGDLAINHVRFTIIEELPPPG